MANRPIILMLFAITIICTQPASALAQLQSVDEAQALSRKTGLPIFVMAGNRT